SGLAPGMLGHGHQVSRPELRHPRWRPRPGVSAPRERTGPVLCRRGRLCPVLAAHGLLKVGGEKMSKSLGNSLLIPKLVEKVRPVELRYYLAQAHYRSTIDYSDEALYEAATAYQRIEHFLTRAVEM